MDGAHRRDYARTQATRLPLQFFNSCIISGLYLGMAIFVVEQGVGVRSGRGATKKVAIDKKEVA